MWKVKASIPLRSRYANRNTGAGRLPLDTAARKLQATGAVMLEGAAGVLLFSPLGDSPSYAQVVTFSD